MAAAGLSMTFLSLFGSLFLAGGLSGIPLGVPPAEPDPAMARIAPEECIFYLTWSGMAEASPDSTNHTERLMAEPEVQRFIKEVTERLNAAIKTGAGEGENARRVAEITPRLVREMIVNQTTAFAGNFAEGPNGMTVPVGIVVNLGDNVGTFEKDLRAMLEILTEQPVPQPENGVTTLVTPLGIPKIQFTFQDGYFILGVSQGTVSQIQQRMAGKTVPGWLTKVHDRLPVDRVSSVTYVNTKGILEAAMPFMAMAGPQAGQVIKSLGIDNLQTVVNVTGLNEKSMLSRTLFELEGKPTGLFAMLDAEPIEAGDLAAIPADATIAFSAKIDPSKTLDRIFTLVDAMERGAGQRARQELAGLQGEIGFSVEKDLFGSLGDTWSVYQSPREGGPLFTNWTAVVSVKNPRRLRAVSETIAKSVRNFEQQMIAMRPGRPRAIGIRTMNVGGHTVHFLNSIGEDMPVAPAWCITDDKLIISLFPQGVSAFLNRSPSTKSLASLPHVQKALSAETPPSKLVHVDSAKICRSVYPLLLIGANFMFAELQREGVDLNISILPEAESIAKHLQPAITTVTNHEDGIEVASTRTLPISLGMSSSVLPTLFFAGVSTSRMTRFGPAPQPGLLDVLSPRRAQRTQASNNLKQIGLAMHNYHEVHGNLPAAVSEDDDEKALLSWRVHILPFIDQGPLYDQFHLDEPWDSEHNKKLIAQMPATYMAPGSKAGKGKTNYVTFRHAKSVFPGSDKIRFRDIKDGTSNTIMAVEADDKNAVTWTKPDDLKFNEKKPKTGLVGLRQGVFTALMCDGSVHFITEVIDNATLTNLVFRDDGKAINFNFRANIRRPVRGIDVLAEPVPDAPVEAVEEAVPVERVRRRPVPPRAVPQRAAPPQLKKRAAPREEAEAVRNEATTIRKPKPNVPPQQSP